MTAVPPFDYELAADLPAALSAVHAGAVPIHGGTELLPAMALGLAAPERVVSIRAVDELRHCGISDGRLVIGSGMTHREISRNDVIQKTAPVLADVTHHVGNIRVRSVGTIGGNLAFAEPRSDVVIALLALGAEVRLVSQDSERSLALADFLLGPFEADVRPGELLTEISVNARDATRAVYQKVVRSERPVVGSCLARLADGRWRLVIGAAALMPTVVEADDPNDFDVEAIAATIDATADLSGSVAYKRHLCTVVVNRCREAIQSTAIQSTDRTTGRT